MIGSSAPEFSHVSLHKITSLLVDFVQGNLQNSNWCLAASLVCLGQTSLDKKSIAWFQTIGQQSLWFSNKEGSSLEVAKLRVCLRGLNVASCMPSTVAHLCTKSRMYRAILRFPKSYYFKYTVLLRPRTVPHQVQALLVWGESKEILWNHPLPIPFFHHLI